MLSTVINFIKTSISFFIIEILPAPYLFSNEYVFNESYSPEIASAFSYRFGIDDNYWYRVLRKESRNWI